MGEVMQKQKKTQQSTYRKETSKRNFRYNRFLLLRYLLAVFFFSNLNLAILYWLGKNKLILIPLGMLVLSVLAIYEHVKLYGETTDKVDHQLRYNLLYHQVQGILNSLLLLSTLANIQFLTFFPFLVNTAKNRWIVAIILILGIGLSLLSIRRIMAIREQKDKHFGYIQEYEKIMK